MTAAVPTMDAFTISAFAAAERSAAQALVTTTWSLASGAGALVSGAVRAALGPDGFTLNLLTLVGCYIVAIAFFAFSFGRRWPARASASLAACPPSPRSCRRALAP